ncbi:DUF2087 domain-containing protein [Microbacterium sp. NPDC064584]|uniref:DUF2087 domain-containing protein n=1 Tax=Microbacterium sp. NPDC064584 TaxID=3155817 RepID=UPI0034387746
MAALPAEGWRAIVAALANDTARAVYAEFVTAGASPTLDALSPSRARHVREALTRSGLLSVDGADLRVVPDVFARALVANPVRPRPQGVERFLGPDGRITAYPADRSVRAELLAHVAARAFPDDRVLSEREVNEQLAAFTDDVAVLRRHLVDHGELARTRSGSEYARP